MDRYQIQPINSKKYVFKGQDNKVSFYFNSTKSLCDDIDIEPGVSKIIFDGAYSCSFELTNVMKQFPDVKEIEISSSVTDIHISNFMFPNVRRVISHSWRFSDGEYLISNKTLLNSFCRHSDEVIDLHDIRNIANYAFAGCMSTNIINTKSLESCSENAFSGSMYRLRESNDDVIQIGCLIDSIRRDVCEITIPADVKQISKNVCVDKLKKVTLKSFSQLFLFDKSKFKDIDTVFFDMTDVINFNFRRIIPECIHNFEISSKNPYYMCKNGILYTKDEKTILLCPPGYKKEELKIEEGVENISFNAFANCKSLRTLILPDSLSFLGDTAFYGCDNLKKIDFGNGVKCIGFGQYVFESCKSLTHIKLPSQILSISMGAFENCRSLSSVELNEGLTSIDALAFTGCVNLNSITIPSSVKNIGKNAFFHTNEFTIKGDMPYGLAGATLNARYIEDEKLQRDIVIIHNNGEDIYIPKYISSDNFSKIDVLLSTKAFSNHNFYTYAVDIESKQDIALKIFNITHNKQMIPYLRRVSKSIATRYLTRNMEDELIEFLKLGFISGSSLKSLLHQASEYDMPSVSAYILKSLNDMDSDNKGGFRL